MSTLAPSEHKTSVVLFDLGGVIVELGGIEHWKSLSGQSDDVDMWRRWLHCPVVKAYESGRCSSDEFASRMVQEHSLPVSANQFITAFTAWPKGLFPGARDVVADVHDDVMVGCFSNTSDLHWHERLVPMGAEDMFALRFLSFEMGHVKPDAGSFAYVAEALGHAPQAILFIDDNPVNVDGAREHGFDAHVAHGPDSARAILQARGLLKTR